MCVDDALRNAESEAASRDVRPLRERFEDGAKAASDARAGVLDREPHDRIGVLYAHQNAATGWRELHGVPDQALQHLQDPIIVEKRPTASPGDSIDRAIPFADAEGAMSGIASWTTASAS